MAVAISKMCIVAKSDKSKSGKIKYSGFGGSKNINLKELQKDVTLLEFWTERDIPVELGTILYAEIDVMGDNVVVRDLYTREEYLKQQ